MSKTFFSSLIGDSQTWLLGWANIKYEIWEKSVLLSVIHCWEMIVNMKFEHAVFNIGRLVHCSYSSSNHSFEIFSYQMKLDKNHDD